MGRVPPQIKWKIKKLYKTRIVKNKEINRIADQIHYGYAGPAWHGPCITKVLDELEPAVLSNTVGNSHNIAEILEHMIAWRVFAIKNMSGTPYDITDDAVNFPKVETLDAANWTDLKMRLAANQEELLSVIRSHSDEKLEEIVPGRKYNFYILLHGIVQHDLYHLGQIVMLKKVVA